MSGATYQVTPGPPVQLSGASLNAGTVIYNSDPNNGVWIGAAGTVSPGNGIRVGPFSTAQWAANKGTLWACVDTGVTAPVSITVSDDVTAVDNPAAIAASVAAKLLAGGVPSVMIHDVLVDHVLIPWLPGSAGMINVDTSKYASVIVQFKTIGDLGPYNVRYSWETANWAILIDSGVLSSDNSQPDTFEMTVKGASLNLQNTLLNNDVIVTVIGSNKPAPLKVKALGYQGVSQYYTASPPAVVGFTNLGPGNVFGPATVTFQMSPLPNNGHLRIQSAAPQPIYSTIAGSREMIQISGASRMVIKQDVALPQNGYIWSVYNETAVASSFWVTAIPNET